MRSHLARLIRGVILRDGYSSRRYLPALATAVLSPPTSLSPIRSSLGLPAPAPQKPNRSGFAEPPPADGDPAGFISARADLTSFVPPLLPSDGRRLLNSVAAPTGPASRRASVAPTSWTLWPRPVAVASRPTQLHCSPGDRGASPSQAEPVHPRRPLLR